MTVHARPEPDPKHPGADLTALHAAMLDAAKAGAGAAFREQLQTSPVDLRTVVLTAADPVDGDGAGHLAHSIGVLNLTAVTVYWGIGGARPQPGAYAIEQPPNTLLVLPVQCGELQLGAKAADLAAGDAVLHVLRYAAVQPAFLGKAA